MTYYVAGIPYSADDIYHHGIKGMVWGVRRFQNPDGSLTPEGIIRYRNRPDRAKQYYKEHFVESYNKAVSELNSRIPDFNKEWESKDISNNEEYNKAYESAFNDMQREIFNKQFDKDFGEIFEVSGVGREYIKKLIG